MSGYSEGMTKALGNLESLSRLGETGRQLEAQVAGIYRTMGDMLVYKEACTGEDVYFVVSERESFKLNLQARADIAKPEGAADWVPEALWTRDIGSRANRVLRSRGVLRTLVFLATEIVYNEDERRVWAYSPGDTPLFRVERTPTARVELMSRERVTHELDPS